MYTFFLCLDLRVRGRAEGQHGELEIWRQGPQSPDLAHLGLDTNHPPASDD